MQNSRHEKKNTRPFSDHLLFILRSTPTEKEIDVRQNLTLIVPLETSFGNILKTHLVQRNLKDKIPFVKLSALQIQQTFFDIIRKARSIIKTTLMLFLCLV